MYNLCWINIYVELDAKFAFLSKLFIVIHKYLPNYKIVAIFSVGTCRVICL